MRSGKELILVAVSFVALSCGGTNSSDTGDFAQADVDQLAATLASSFGAASTTQASAAAAGNALTLPSATPGDALSTSVAVNQTVACPASGHVTTTGNIYATCPNPPATGACTMSGAVTFNFGDRTNNLNDCTYANGLVVDGGLFLTITGSANGAAVTLTETLNGSLSLNRKGPTGGLVPISVNALDTCFVFLTAKIPEHTITGSICGHDVTTTF